MSRNFRKSVVPDGEATVGLPFVKRELGKQTYGPGRLVKYVQLLVDECGFPPPIPEMVRDRLVHEVTEGSAFRRAPVEAWIQDMLPPANAAAIDARALSEAADDMDAAASNLRLVSARA
jgi:hypothetical protein